MNKESLPLKATGCRVMLHGEWLSGSAVHTPRLVQRAVAPPTPAQTPSDNAAWCQSHVTRPPRFHWAQASGVPSWNSQKQLGDRNNRGGSGIHLSQSVSSGPLQRFMTRPLCTETLLCCLFCSRLLAPCLSSVYSINLQDSYTPAEILRTLPKQKQPPLNLTLVVFLTKAKIPGESYP